MLTLMCSLYILFLLVPLLLVTKHLYSSELEHSSELGTHVSDSYIFI